jgi:hypothetical protein
MNAAIPAALNKTAAVVAAEPIGLRTVTLGDLPHHRLRAFREATQWTARVPGTPWRFLNLRDGGILPWRNGMLASVVAAP